ncbi:hypothetical protein [Nocardioides sp.]|uniref:hypothetical protein n=1 Tax=Nocardioides sp. TaxID=35761 RepID=UPI0035299A61
MSGLLLAGAWLLAPFLPWRRSARLVARVRARLAERRRPAHGRPVERIAADARRLSVWYRTCPRGQSFAKYEAHRRAYDDVLAEACTALGIDHLLGVLEPGPELDLERARVEARLEQSGLPLGLPL